MQRPLVIQLQMACAIGVRKICAKGKGIGSPPKRANRPLIPPPSPPVTHLLPSWVQIPPCGLAWDLLLKVPALIPLRWNFLGKAKSPTPGGVGLFELRTT
jgi:hypothetical protein